MPRIVRCGLALTLAIALAAPRAHASGAGASYSGSGAATAAGLGMLVFGVPDAVLTVLDMASIAAGQPRSIGYATFETLFAAPQLIVALTIVSASPPSGFWTGYTIWVAALTTHGIWSMAAALRAGAPRELPPGGPPAPDALQIGIGPTYVPVGQLSHPGFGLVGRF